MKNKVIGIVVTVLISILAIIGVIQIRESNIAKFNSLDDKKESVSTKTDNDKKENITTDNVEVQNENEIESKIESNEEEIKNNDNKIEKVEEKKEKVKVVDDNSNKQQTSEKNNNIVEKEEVDNSTSQQQPVVESNTTVTKTEENKVINNNQQQNKPEETKTQTENNKNNPWDSLGITEYEFYNTPAHSWAELDFKLSDYGSREATFNACNKYGEEHKAEYGGRFECLPINSYSGNYIGEDIDFD